MRSHEFYVLNLIKVLGASLVVASHYGGHFLGVDFYAFGTGAFFIVAGFYALNAETARGLHYLAKRLVRLYPGYLVAVGAYLLVRGIPSGDWPYLAGHHALFLLATPDVATVFSLNPAFWSLPVFFSFFLIVALLPRQVSPSLAGITLLALLPFVVLELGWRNWREGYVEWLAFPMHFYAFWFGGWLGRKAKRFSGDAVQTRGSPWPASGLVLLIVILASRHGEVASLLPGGGHLYRTLMVVLFGALLWTLLRAGERLREWPPIGWLGGISFGVFLFHNLTLVAVARYLPELAGLPAALLALLMALLTAWLVKKVVEEPVQKRCRSALKALSAGGRQGSGSTLLVPASWLGRVTGLVAMALFLRLSSLAMAEGVGVALEALWADLPWLLLLLALVRLTPSLVRWRFVACIPLAGLLALYVVDAIMHPGGGQRFWGALGGLAATDWATSPIFLLWLVLSWLLARVLHRAPMAEPRSRLRRVGLGGGGLVLLMLLALPGGEDAWQVQSVLAGPVHSGDEAQAPQVQWLEPEEVVEMGDSWERSLLLHSSLAGPAGVAELNARLEPLLRSALLVEPGITILGITSEGEFEVVSRVSAKDSAFVATALDTDHAAHAVVVHAATEPEVLRPLADWLEAHGLTRWSEWAPGHAYLGLILSDGRSRERLKQGASVSLYLLPLSAG